MKPCGEMRVLCAVPTSPEAKSIITISRKVNMTYSHTWDLLEILEKNKLVSSRKIGRVKLFTKTPRGFSVAYAWKRFWKIYEGIE